MSKTAKSPDRSAVLNVIRPGSHVRLGDVSAIVQAVLIVESNRVTYQVVWWAAAERKEAWVSAFEVEPVDALNGLLPLGFVHGRA